MIPPRIPVDSADARELREAHAEADAVQPPLESAVPADQHRRTAHDPRCRRGWLGEDPGGRPIPCLLCRPWLAHVDCWTCSTTWQACHHQRHAHHGHCCPNCNHKPTKEGR